MKKILVILTSFLLLTILAGITATKAETGSNNKNLLDGTYEGISFKFPWFMHISLTVKEEKISAIKVTGHKALKKYTDMLQPLIKKIIQSQSTKVDAVSGATISSNALKKAVNNAIAKAADAPSPDKTE